MSWVEPSVFFVVCANPRRGLNQRVFVVVNTASLHTYIYIYIYMHVVYT